MNRIKGVSLATKAMDDNYKRTDYKERKGKRASHAWNYFWHKKDALKAQCRLCTNKQPSILTLIPTANGNTAGLFRHLELHHNIFIHKSPNSERTEKDAVEEEQRSNEAPSTSKAISKGLSSFVTRIDFDNIDGLMTDLVARDGLSFRGVAKSRVLRKLFAKAGYGELPRSHVTVRNRVTSIGSEIKKMVVSKIQDVLSAGHKYSLTLDEWTENNNRRYLNVTLHDQNGICTNLGLAAASDCIQLVKTKLKDFGLDMTQHIVGSTTDGASMMKKFHDLSQIIGQLCMTHAIQLAVIDVFYKGTPTKLQQAFTKGNDSDTSEDDDEGIVSISVGDTSEQEQSDDESDVERTPTSGKSLQYKSEAVKKLTEKIRKIARMFHKSPQKFAILCEQMEKDRVEITETRGKPLRSHLKLILDVRTRWSSLYFMVKRFSELQSSIEKTLIDLRNRNKLSKKQISSIQLLTDDEKELLSNLIVVLAPVNMAVEEICHRQVNLLSFEAIAKILLTSLSQSNVPEFGVKLKLALERRFTERRTIWTRVLYTLHHGYAEESICSDCDEEDDANELQLLPKQLKCNVNSLLKRLLNPSDYPDSDDDITEPPSVSRNNQDPQNQAELSLKEQMQLARQQLYKTPIQKVGNIYRKGFMESINTEIGEFCRSGLAAQRGYHLNLAYNFLLTIRPSSVESERVFSLAGLFATKLRSQLGDTVLDTSGLVTWWRHGDMSPA